MKYQNYKVCRDNIYVGKVVKASHIYRYKSKAKLIAGKSGKLFTDAFTSYRTMLFIPNEENLANDLLYNSPSYPILNITDDQTCLNLDENNIVITDACNLGELLRYFDYPEELTFEDIIKIRKTFFTGNFVENNPELFGMREMKPEEITYYENGIIVTDPKKLKRRIKKERRLQKRGEKSFCRVSESILPNEYEFTLDRLGNNSLEDIIFGFETKINAFTPTRKEKTVKKLIKM